MGLLGALAGAAMQHFGSPQAAAQPGLAEDAAPYGDDLATDEQGRAMLMIRAMIAAAKADGEIDPQERQRIMGRLEQAGADPEAQAFVRDEIARPVDLQTIVSTVDTPHTAIEAYAASLFAIDLDTPAEAAYMRQLAQGLGLDTPPSCASCTPSLEAPKPTDLTAAAGLIPSSGRRPGSRPLVDAGSSWFRPGMVHEREPRTASTTAPWT